MDISNLLNDPQKLNETFEKALEEKDMTTINILLPHVKNPWLIYQYAKKIVGGKVSDELEDIIAQDPQTSINYAQDILGGRFPKGEPTIISDNKFLSDYIMELSQDEVLNFLKENNLDKDKALISYFVFHTDEAIDSPFYSDLRQAVLRSNDLDLKIYFFATLFRINGIIDEELRKDILNNLTTEVDPIFLYRLSPEKTPIKEIEDILYNKSPQEIKKDFNKWTIGGVLYYFYQIYDNDIDILKSKFPNLYKAIKKEGYKTDEEIESLLSESDEINIDPAEIDFDFLTNLQSKYS